MLILWGQGGPGLGQGLRNCLQSRNMFHGNETTSVNSCSWEISILGRKNLRKILYNQSTIYQEVDCYAIFAKSTFSNIHKWDKCNLSTLKIITISRRQVKDPKDTYLPKGSNFSTYILKSRNAFFQDLHPRSCLLSGGHSSVQLEIWEVK